MRMRCLAWVAAAFLLCAGCAPVRHPRPFPVAHRGVGHPTADPTAFAAVPAPAAAPVAPASSPCPPYVPGPSPYVGAMPAPTNELTPSTPWGEGARKSYLIPAADIVGFNFLLNAYSRYVLDDSDFDSNLSTIRSNLSSGWVIDDDPFATNQIMHPYQGSIEHGFARSAGLNYWEALGYDLGASTLWEIAGETLKPSLNDEITTVFSGSFLGEVFFRMASLMLENEGRKPGFFRELAAARSSPSTGFNRLVFGDRFDAVFPSHDPAVFWRASIGARRNAKLTDLGVLSRIQQDQAVAGYSMDYGLPGKPGYEYSRPFDYFSFAAAITSSTHSLPESVMIRGLLYGSKYERGDDFDGIWGLYGCYDYMSPEVFSISSTALGLGTTGQYRISDALTLQGTVLGGVGWSAVGTIADAEKDRDYQYGVSPQGLLAFRLIHSDVAMLDLTGRSYYVGGAYSNRETGSESVFRGEASLTVRVYGHHALGIQFVATYRDANLNDLPDRLQTVGAVNLFYTYVSDTKFGVVGSR